MRSNATATIKTCIATSIAVRPMKLSLHCAAAFLVLTAIAVMIGPTLPAPSFHRRAKP